MSSILFIKTSSLGDVVHQLPAMTDARRRFPAARIVWVAEEAFVPLARLHPAIDEVIPVATRRWRYQPLDKDTWREVVGFRQSLRSVGAETVIDTQGLIRSAVISRLSHGVRHGYDHQSITETPASFFYNVKHRVSRALHAVTRNRVLTGLSLGYDSFAQLDYGLGHLIPAKRSRHALLFHGTSRAEKEWSDAEWIKVGQWIAAQAYTVLLPWGNEREHARCRYLSSFIPGATILENLPIDKLAEITATASFVVGVDTGLLQLAAACGTPLASIFISSNVSLTGPTGSGPIVCFDGSKKNVSADEVIRSLERDWINFAV
jgi:heptosyltransferase I